MNYPVSLPTANLILSHVAQLLRLSPKSLHVLMIPAFSIHTKSSSIGEYHFLLPAGEAARNSWTTATVAPKCLNDQTWENTPQGGKNIPVGLSKGKPFTWATVYAQSLP